MVVVKWSACLPPTPMIRPSHTAEVFNFSVKLLLNRNKINKKEAVFKKVLNTKRAKQKRRVKKNKPQLFLNEQFKVSFI